MNTLSKLAAVVAAGTVLGLVSAGNASAYNLTNTRPAQINGNSLQNVFNTIKANDPTQNPLSAKNDQSKVALWDVNKSASSSATLIIELAGLSGNNRFGLYDPLTGTKTQIFEGNDVGNNVRKDVANIVFGPGGLVTITEIKSSATDETDGLTNTGLLTSNLFGFYLENDTQGTFFTEDALNFGGKAQALVYEGNGNKLTLPGIEGTNPDLTFDRGQDWIIAWEDVRSAGDKDYDDMVLKLGGVGAAVPEPLTMLGAGAAASFGAFFKRQTAKRQKKEDN